MKPEPLHQEFNQATRIPWREDCSYGVLVHRDWTAKAKKERRMTLKHHPLYWIAKTEGDYIAAQQVVDDLLNQDILLKLCERIGSRKPIIVAPSLTKEDPKNVIPIWFAYNVAYHLDLKVSREIFQADKSHRTGRSGFYRLAHDPEFYGTVIPNQDYLIVDDVLTMGGTLASLRGFIESKGGKVIATTVLADSNIKARVAHNKGLEFIESQSEVFLKPTAEAMDELRKKHGYKLSKLWESKKGYGLECLTAREVDFLRFYPTLREIKKAFDEQDGGGDSQGPRGGRKVSSGKSPQTAPSGP